MSQLCNDISDIQLNIQVNNLILLRIRYSSINVCTVSKGFLVRF